MKKIMNQRVSVSAILSLCVILILMQQPDLYAQGYQNGLFDSSSDVGDCSITGKTYFDAKLQTYSLSGSGSNIWSSEDAFHYAWKKVKGDFILQARISFIGEGKHEHRKIGIMLRQTPDKNSAHISAVVHGDGLTSLQYRKNTGGETEELRSGISAADMIQLERKGNRYIFSAARFGEPFDTVSTVGYLSDEVLAGIFICSHDNSVEEKALFSNVRLYYTAKDDFIPYEDYIGSNLEILDLESLNRRVIHQTPGSIQAPNWTVDGKYLIYNGEGLLHRFDLASGKPDLLPTGTAVNNNNDHVLSFDGKWLGISNHVASEDFKSIIFVLPSEGGIPKRITAKGPSYLHGWSPDGQYLIYTAERNGDFDIYRNSLKGKKEVRLTDAPGLDDGSEYSPDGRYIYFNSSRTGTMQLWRMKPDGSEQEQLTFDEWNDWFPHISPDGRTIVFLSFPKEVNASDHPFYKRVVLRRMPVEGGTPEIIAYLYGGQGTINVPSFSPDGKKIAFISNSILE